MEMQDASWEIIETVELDRSKIISHENKNPLELKLGLVEWFGHDGHIELILWLTENKQILRHCTIDEWRRNEASGAKIVYRQILDKLKRGEYTVHLYDERKLGIEFPYVRQTFVEQKALA